MIQLEQILHNPEQSVCFTGHRKIEDLKGLSWRLHDQIVEHIKKHRCLYFISGVAIGFDQIASRIVLKLQEKHPGIYLIAAIPCKDQDKLWNKEDREMYKYILSKADAVVYVSEQEYQPHLMMKRNDWMLDNSKYVIAGYNGQNKGGTANCIRSAEKKKKQIVNVWK